MGKMVRLCVWLEESLFWLVIENKEHHVHHAELWEDFSTKQLST